MTFTRKIVIALALGIATGVVLGDLVAPLKIAADGFVRLLQMTVLPYVTISIIVAQLSRRAAHARVRHQAGCPRLERCSASLAP